MEQKYSLKNDVIFKYVFSHSKNKNILIALLNSILGFKGNERINSIIILNPMNLKRYLDDKFSILDIKAEDERGHQYNIEMQIKSNKDYISRVIYYHDKLYIEQLNKNETYENLLKTISISILDFILFKNEADLHNIYRYKNIKTEKELTDIKEIHFIELPKFNKDKPKSLSTEFEKWLHVLKFGDLYENIENLPEELRSEEEIYMAIKQMNSALADRKLKEIINMREKAELDELSRLANARYEGIKEGELKGKMEGKMEGIAEGELKGKMEGIAEGELKGKIESARSLLQSGMSKQEILRILGIDESSF